MFKQNQPVPEVTGQMEILAGLILGSPPGCISLAHHTHTHSCFVICVEITGTTRGAPLN